MKKFINIIIWIPIIGYLFGYYHMFVSDKFDYDWFIQTPQIIVVLNACWHAMWIAGFGMWIYSVTI